MTEVLTPTGYEQTKEKLADLEQRLAQLSEHASSMNEKHYEESRDSYERMIAQYLRELKLFEASHPEVVNNR